MGCLIAPFINQRYGRKFCMYTMGVGSIVGTAVQLASTANLNFWVLVVGKLVLNTSVGISAGSIGTYVAECAPASCRGLLLNMVRRPPSFSGLALAAVLSLTTSNSPSSSNSTRSARPSAA